MGEKENKQDNNSETVFIILLVLLAGLIAYGGYELYQLKNVAQERQASLDQVASDYQSLQELYFGAQRDIRDLESQVNELQEDKKTLVEAYQKEQQQTEEFQQRISRMGDEINRYEKLQQIDEEILQKYSKNYFLNENYKPSATTTIPDKYVYQEEGEEERQVTIHSKVYPFLENMLEAARRDGIEIAALSGYRSFEEQSELKSKYNIIYGEGTSNAFAASQGYSEHQLGTTIDFTTPAMEGRLDGFENSEAYSWLQDNAYKYGFILSYPQENQYYVFEPWHWRFVGKELADYLHDQNLHFYEMDQREIDEYRIHVFD